MLQFDRQGLIPAVIQDESNGQVLMVAFMNAEALQLTRTTGYVHLFSRARNTIWRKGEQSGHIQEIRAIYVNCEESSLLLKVVQHGAGACHTGHRSCYYRRLLEDDRYETIEALSFDPTAVYAQNASEQKPAPAPISQQEIQQLESDMRKLYSAYIFLRDHDLSTESNTSRLLQEPGIEYLVGRLGDELQELADVQAGTHVHSDRQSDTVLEASQVGYWLMLLAAARNVKYDAVRPHEAILAGYQMSAPRTLEQDQECLSLLTSENPAEIIQGLVMGFTTLGRTCAEAGVSPLAPAEYDMAQMRRKGLV
ncbi:MAG TPA: phosphoribosyl-AMP cyclohydrolase [Ktedonobacteraceae bacterium]|jgi:phosphoribosyl-AMP cyclohydrolase/phosphoribosyl-ATP pyrophosphohydrolase